MCLHLYGALKKAARICLRARVPARTCMHSCMCVYVYVCVRMSVFVNAIGTCLRLCLSAFLRARTWLHELTSVFVRVRARVCLLACACVFVRGPILCGKNVRCVFM